MAALCAWKNVDTNHPFSTQTRLLISGLREPLPAATSQTEADRALLAEKIVV
jgi:hypothetical protein